ncbi:restin homolog [Drosophila subobscura]|uniref:restin homolog n=1 Tax=Drosophila subobscura TaxID=7241 RepID=UPI00155A60C6|nr:restin homolog [Drosophila subobscura]
MRIEFIIFSLLFAIICLTAEATGYSGNSRFRKRSKRLLPYAGGSTDDSKGGGRDGCNHDSQQGDNQLQDQEHQQAPRPRKQKSGNAKQRASGIAVQAAKEAKKANDDMASAVKVASDKIKNEYADKAMSAAKAAEAVLAGKGQMLEQLEAEVREAEVVVQEESQELVTAESNAQLALKQFQQAQTELKMLLATLKVARESKESAEQMNAVWQQSLTEKTALLEAAQNRVAVLLRQLRDARSDHNKTKKAALKALCAAKEAKQRIEQAEAVRL